MFSELTNTLSNGSFKQGLYQFVVPVPVVPHSIGRLASSPVCAYVHMCICIHAYAEG